MGKSKISCPLAPSGDRIVIVRDQPDQVSEGGVFIPAKAQTEETTGLVVAVGPMAEGMSVGQTVLFSSYSGAEFERDGSKWLIMSVDDVLAVLK